MLQDYWMINYEPLINEMYDQYRKPERYPNSYLHLHLTLANSSAEDPQSFHILSYSIQLQVKVLDAQA